jgi:hypothetical protein
MLLSVRPERGLSKRCLFLERKIRSVLRQVHFGRVPETQTTPLRVLPGVMFTQGVAITPGCTFGKDGCATG